MSYVDGYVLPVPKKHLATYRRIASKAGKIWREHGAVDYRECVGDDLAVKFGMPFTKLVKPKAGEAVVFSYIVFKSRAHRDKVNAKVWPTSGCRICPRPCRSTSSAWPTADSRLWSRPERARYKAA